MDRQPTSLYIHIPFCSVRCGYCDFNTYAGFQHLIPEYVKALQNEIAFIGKTLKTRLHIQTIYFGGGTPSLLSAAELGNILAEINKYFFIEQEPEITLEANPNNLTGSFARDLGAAGINRLSVGVQSMHPEDLKTLERQHDPYQVINAIHHARKAGIKNISLDLIFGIPGQTLNRWESTLELVAEMEPEHLSLYSLTLEEGTALSSYYGKGYLPLIDDDLTADMYELAMDFLPGKGYQQYEISNWARHDTGGNLQLSRHNRHYWLNKPYIGVGAGAHGSWLGCRLANRREIVPYIISMAKEVITELPATPATVELIEVDKLQEMQETMMVGLRLTLDGVSKQAFYGRFGIIMEDVFGNEINQLVENGLLEWTVRNGQDCLRLTKRGRLLGNLVFREFV